jgi:hypothetical protein
MKKLWIWNNGDWCILEDVMPLDTRGRFVDDEIQRGELWRKLVEDSSNAI